MTRQSPVIKVRIWNDWYPYKKMFVHYGFWQLARAREIQAEWVPYEALMARGAPAMVGPPYESHKNILVLEILRGAETVNVVYDANDSYYKIPNDLLRWSHLYYKSNYQPAYYKAGEPLTEEYWSAVSIRPELLPEKLDLSQTHKIRPCSFSMELWPSRWRNRFHFRQMENRWARTLPQNKKASVFYLGRYWAGRAGLTRQLFKQVEAAGATVAGGIVPAHEELPSELARYAHGSVSLGAWGKLASQARVGLMERGLDGSMSFKIANFLMLGMPFIALRPMSNFWKPVEPGLHYFEVREDFSDLAEILLRCTDDSLREMGARNFALWCDYICPAATARHILREAVSLAA